MKHTILIHSIIPFKRNRSLPRHLLRPSKRSRTSPAPRPNMLAPLVLGVGQLRDPQGLLLQGTALFLTDKRRARPDVPGTSAVPYTTNGTGIYAAYIDPTKPP